jgi:hypothetical protein
VPWKQRIERCDVDEQKSIAHGMGSCWLVERNAEGVFVVLFCRIMRIQARPEVKLLLNAPNSVTWMEAYLA